MRPRFDWMRKNATMEYVAEDVEDQDYWSNWRKKQNKKETGYKLLCMMEVRGSWRPFPGGKSRISFSWPLPLKFNLKVTSFTPLYSQLHTIEPVSLGDVEYSSLIGPLGRVLFGSSALKRWRKEVDEPLGSGHQSAADFRWPVLGVSGAFPHDTPRWIPCKKSWNGNRNAVNLQRQ